MEDEIDYDKELERLDREIALLDKEIKEEKPEIKDIKPIRPFKRSFLNDLKDKKKVMDENAALKKKIKLYSSKVLVCPSCNRQLITEDTRIFLRAEVEKIKHEIVTKYENIITDLHKKINALSVILMDKDKEIQTLNEFLSKYKNG